MSQRPNRPPNNSMPFELPTPESIERMRQISNVETPTADDVRFLARVLWRLCEAVGVVAEGLQGVSRGNVVTIDPDIEH